MNDEIEIIEIPHDIPDPSETPDQYAWRTLDEEMLNAGIEKLSEGEQRIIYMTYYEDMNSFQIAKMFYFKDATIRKDICQ